MVIKKCDQESKLYYNINESENTLLQSQISAVGKQNEIGKYFNENRKGRRTGTEKVKAECDLFAKRARERGRTEQNNEKEKLKI